MKKRKLLAVMLSVSLLSLSSTPAWAIALDNHEVNDQSQEIIQIIDAKEEQAKYQGFIGVVKEIKEKANIPGGKMIALENSEGMPANMIISEKTLIIGSDEIQVGDMITGYYDESKPMIMIYPPQYSVEMLIVGLDHLISVNQNTMTVSNIYFNQQGKIMLPLRAICESLGYKVTWKAKDQSIMIDDKFLLFIGKESNGFVPELNESITYVPLEYFQKVMKLKVVID